METARRIRVTEGKHVIPVPTFELKKDFSGYILDPLQIFKSKGNGAKPYISEKSIIRPTFSYLGNFTISDSVFRQIIQYMANKAPAIYKIAKTRVEIKTAICAYPAPAASRDAASGNATNPGFRVYPEINDERE